MSRDLVAIAGSAGLSLLGRVANGVLVFLYGILVARLLDVESVGVLALGLAILRIAEIAGRAGLELGALHHVAVLAGSRRGASVPGTVANSVRVVAACSLAIAAMLVAFAAPLAARFGSPALVPVIRVLAISLPFTSVAMIYLSALLALRRVGANTTLEKVLLPTVNLAACGLLVVAGFGVAGASAAYVLAAALTCPLAAYAFRRAVAREAEGVPAPIGIGELLRFSGPILLVTLLTQLLGWIDTLMLGLMHRVADVGIYSAAVRTALVASLIVGSFNAIFASTISDLHHRGDLERLGFLFKAVGKWTFLATLPLVLAVMLLSPEIMRLYGAPFVAGSGALDVLALTQLVGASAGSVGYMLTLSGRQRWMVLNISLACLASVGLNALLIPRFGMVGAAWSTCLALALFNALSLVQVRASLHMHPYNAAYLRILAAGVLPFALLTLVKANAPPLPYGLAIAAYGLAYGLLYLLALFALGFAKEEEVILTRLKQGLLGRP
jgi:O-antigen/teichoic acid export membrane protein